MSALAHALDYAAHGLPVLPIKPGEKRPPMAGWQNHATTDKPTIENWFTGLYADHMTSKNDWEIFIDMQRDQLKTRKAFKNVLKQLDDVLKEVA